MQDLQQLDVKTANVADIKHIIWNSKSDKHPMGDLKVRQAIMHAIPWDDVAGALSGGIGEATPLFATPDSWAYKEGTEFYDYDVELANLHWQKLDILMDLKPRFTARHRIMILQLHFRQSCHRSILRQK